LTESLQHSLIANPEAGDVIPGSGGVRTLRLGVGGRGKRGGIRAIYLLRLWEGEIYSNVPQYFAHWDGVPRTEVEAAYREYIDHG
jgi:hypothetical protein